MMEYGYALLADALSEQDEERFIGLVPEGLMARPSGQQLLRRISRRVVGWA